METGWQKSHIIPVLYDSSPAESRKGSADLLHTISQRWQEIKWKNLWSPAPSLKRLSEVSQHCLLCGDQFIVRDWQRGVWLHDEIIHGVTLRGWILGNEIPVVPGNFHQILTKSSCGNLGLLAWIFLWKSFTKTSLILPSNFPALGSVWSLYVDEGSQSSGSWQF